MIKQKKPRPVRHIYWFQIKTKGRIPWPVKVINATEDVTLTLLAEHTAKSLELNGAGNTQICTMAICTEANADRFPHPVPPHSYVDWFYSRVYISSKHDKNGMPIECYAYLHSDNIGRLNDTPGGQRKLLAELQAAGGERTIRLRAMPKRKKASEVRLSSEKRVRAPRQKTQLRGAKLRFAVASLGA